MSDEFDPFYIEETHHQKPRVAGKIFLLIVILIALMGIVSIFFRNATVEPRSYMIDDMEDQINQILEEWGDK